MRSYIVRSVPLLALAIIAACGTPEAGAARLKKLTVGISRDSALKVLGEGPLTASGADTVRVVNGFRHMRYFTEGQLYEVVYVRDQPGDVREYVEQSVETPIVLDPAGKVLGWGWKYYVKEAMKKFKLPTPLLPVDSAAKAAAKAGATPPPVVPATTPAAPAASTTPDKNTSK